MAMCFLYLGLGVQEPSTFTSHFGLQNLRPDRSIPECKPLCSTSANRNVQKLDMEKIWRPEVRRLKQSCARICKSNILYKSWNLTIAYMIIYMPYAYFLFDILFDPFHYADTPPGGHQKGVDLWPWPEKTFRHRGCHHEGGVRWTVEERSKLKVHQMHCWRQDLDHPHICKLMETYEKGSCLAMISQIFWGTSDCSHAFKFISWMAWWVIPNCLGSSREFVDWLQLCCSGGSIYMMYICVFFILKKWLMSIHWRFFRLWA